MIHSKLALVIISPLLHHAVTSFQLMPGPRSLGNTHLEVSRRTVFEVTVQGVLSTTLLPSIASAAPPTLDDLKRLQVGHSRVQYLLKNWEKLTETCNNKAMSETESRQVVRTEGGGKVLVVSSNPSSWCPHESLGGGICDKNPLVVSVLD